MGGRLIFYYQYSLSLIYFDSMIQFLSKSISIFLILLTFISLPFIGHTQEEEKRIHSIVDSSYTAYMTLIHEFNVNVNIDSAWNAYTTKEGWEGAFVAQAEVDFRINGTILTSYNKNAIIGDGTTIVLNVLNFISGKMITLQADIAGNFAGFTKDEARDLYNVIFFEEISNTKTRIRSYGLGYSSTLPS